MAENEIAISGDLNQRQRDAVKLLAEGANQKEAAQQVGVARETVNRWLKNPAFLQAFRDEIGAEFSVLMGKAVSVLSDALENEDKWLSYKAAVYIIDHALRDESGVGNVTVQLNMPKPGMPGSSVEVDGDIT